MPGLFGTLNIGKSGLFAQQYAIDVTSHNISNANTDGYTRQRAIMQATEPYCMPSVESSTSPGQVGTGAEVSTIQRIRNEFLDYQIRNENSQLGNSQVTSDFLTQVENVFNGIGDDVGLNKAIGDFYQSFNALSTSPGDSSTRGKVSTAAKNLATELNSDYKTLTQLKSDILDNIKNTVNDVNSNLNSIDNFNQQIMAVKISGQEPNDLMDKRDSLLDEVSNEFGITINKSKYYGIDVSGVTDTASTPTNSTLIKAVGNADEKRVSYIDSIVQDKDGAGNPISGQYTLQYYKLGDSAAASNRVTVTLTNVSSDQLNELQESRIIWANKSGNIIDKDGNALSGSVDCSKLMLFKSESGKLKGYSDVVDDIDGYIDNLNKIAKSIAFSINAVHSGVTNSVNAGDTIPAPTQAQGPQAADYMPFFVNSDTANSKYTLDSTKNIHLLYDPSVTDHTNTNGTNNLRDVLAAEQDINAGNFSVNQQLIDDPNQIKVMQHDDQFAYTTYNTIDDKGSSGKGERATAMGDLKSVTLDINTISSTSTRNNLVKILTQDMSLGVNTIANSTSGTTVNNYYASVVEKLGNVKKSADDSVTNHTGALTSYNEQKEATSGVSSDEEVANLVQYMHAYQANAKVIATVSELLDVVINGLKK